MGYIVINLITNDHTGDQRSLHYRWIFDIEEFLEDHFIEHNHLLICI